MQGLNGNVPLHDVPLLYLPGLLASTLSLKGNRPCVAAVLCSQLNTGHLAPHPTNVAPAIAICVLDQPELHAGCQQQKLAHSAVLAR